MELNLEALVITVIEERSPEFGQGRAGGREERREHAKLFSAPVADKTGPKIKIRLISLGAVGPEGGCRDHLDIRSCAAFVLQAKAKDKLVLVCPWVELEDNIV